MSSITIRNLDEKLKASLRIRAARHGWSMEQEVRNILQSTLATDDSQVNGLDFALRINQRFASWQAGLSIRQALKWPPLLWLQT